jgi:hypothetical protein
MAFLTNQPFQFFARVKATMMGDVHGLSDAAHQRRISSVPLSMRDKSTRPGRGYVVSGMPVSAAQPMRAAKAPPQPTRP